MLRIKRRRSNGTFGVVYKVRYVPSSRIYALKDVLSLNSSAVFQTIQEVETLNRISHDNVVKQRGRPHG